MNRHGRFDKTTNEINMLEGSLWDKILLFALPIAAGSILQQLFNAVDVAVVGRFASSEALAAVGSNAAVITLMLNLFIGMSVGTNVIIARYVGQNNRKKISDAVHTSMLLAFISGIAMLIFGNLIARPVLVLMSTPEDVLPLSVLYLRIYCLGMPAIMIYNFGAAILRSIGDTKRPLFCLILSGMINAILNVFFVVVCHMSVSGVAIATVLSNVISAAMVLWYLYHEEGDWRFAPRRLAIHKEQLLFIMKIGIPAGLQGMVFSFSNVFIQSAINGFGSKVVAGSAVAVNFEFICYFTINGFNQAAVTFIGQNYGAGNMERCKKVYRICLVAAVICCMTCNVGFYLGRSFIVPLFTANAQVAYYAMQRFRYVLLFQWMASSYEVTGSALRGYGYSTTPAMLTVFGTCVLRLVWIQTVCEIYHTFFALMMVYPVTWAVTGIMVVSAYIFITRCRLPKTDGGF